MSGDKFAFDDLTYPSFVVVFGGSKHHISSHNRTEFDEHFACDVCMNADQARRLLEGYDGYPQYLKVYAVPAPTLVASLPYDSPHAHPQYYIDPITYDGEEIW